MDFRWRGVETFRGRWWKPEAGWIEFCLLEMELFRSWLHVRRCLREGVGDALIEGLVVKLVEPVAVD